MIKKKIRNICFYTLITFYIIIYLSLIKIDNYKKYSYYEDIDHLISKVEINTAEKTIANNSLNLIDYYKKYYDNNDIIGILNIDNTNITTLLVQTNNNKYYLNHAINKKQDPKGAIFLDYRTPLNSKQINIYGHNSKTLPVKFKELEKFVDKKYYNAHKYINIWDGTNDNKYEIASIQIVNNDYEHLITNSINGKEHIKKLSKSLYNTNVPLKENDNLLIIQTCWYNPQNSFLVIIAKKIK